MKNSTREDFATKVDPDILASMRALEKSDGRGMQALVDEAFSDYLAKRRQEKPRPNVMAAYESSIEPFAPLYKKLAE
ncbi:hypothetical protein [Rhodospirillum sp. A1_3_36]|uniref:hypothetical protein n=1 Tax=Rhodospirillum sp. A1_3_36 TaxID=3391666 RepID=UPI0039A403EB